MTNGNVLTIEECAADVKKDVNEPPSQLWSIKEQFD
jgi:hypothetical protein